jgi:poly-gamma-glutamate synthesis protein (capsule biosynthesis protein)
MTPPRSARAAGVLLLAAVLAACSSGGADGQPVTVTRTSTPSGMSSGPVGEPAGSTPASSRTAAGAGTNTTATATTAPESTHQTTPRPATTITPRSVTGHSSSAPRSTAPATPTAPNKPTGEFTLALAGDVNFSERTAELLAADPDTALRQAAAELDKADITMVNLETAITTGGTPAPKQFHFRAPATALRALAAGGVDVATMANNHAVDYGDVGLADTLAAIKHSPIPVIGIGADAAAAYAPYTATVNGVRVAILAASQVQDWTLATHSATDSRPGIANAYSDRLVQAVTQARKHADVVVVYLHWGIEYESCPSAEQRSLAAALAAAGAAAVVGTHAHVLQGAGWRDDGSYVAYGLGNYYWWRSFGNEQDDNGVLTLTFRHDRVTAAHFLATHLDDRGVPIVATGAQRERILAEWADVRECADLLAAPPGH